MANDSKKSEEIKVVRVSNDEVQDHLKAIGCNIDIGGATFKESDIQKEFNQATSNNSTDSTSGNNGGAQPSKTEFVDAGKANILDMLDRSIIVTIGVSEKKERKEDKESDKQDKEHEKE